jgi:hypothetical protein
MSVPAAFADRLKHGLARMGTHPPEGDAEAIQPLRRSLERTLARVATAGPVPAAAFRFQLTSGKPILFQGKEALPLEPARLVPLLNAIQVELQPGESLDLDGGLAAWLIRPDATLTESNLRQADLTLRGLKSGRDRDHAAAQAAESAKIRLRSRLTQLVTALQFAQGDTPPPGMAVAPPVAVAIQEITPVPTPPPPAPPPPPPKSEAPPPPPPPPRPEPAPAAPAVAENPGPAPLVVSKGLGKILCAIEGSGFKCAVIGDVGHVAWGGSLPVRRIEILANFEGPQRETVLSAARGEGLRPAADDEPLHLEYEDRKIGGTVLVDLVQAVTAFQKQVLTRAQAMNVLQAYARVASCEDLILLRAASSKPGHAESVVDLLRATASRLDAAYVKKEALASGVMEPLKAAWQQAKQPR